MKLHRITAMLWNYYYDTIHSADRLFDVFYWPILDIFIWGFMTYFIQGLSEVRLINVILGGILLWVFIWRASQDIAVYLLENFWTRNVYHLFASPLRTSELAISLFIVGAVRSFVAFIVMAILSYLLYGFKVISFNILHFSLFVLILFLFAWGIGLLISSFIFRWGSRVQVLAWSIIWVIQPFSCVFYPLSALPLWAAKIAVFLPTTHVFEGMRASLQGLAINYQSLAYAFLFSVIFLIISAWVLSLAIKRSKHRGLLAKPE
ncbi:ABC transporter permease [Candidatus Woesearchaeota archaeon]|nr:ABC transporter permease [Candidatus Woesearchaeota archaeon]